MKKLCLVFFTAYVTFEGWSKSITPSAPSKPIMLMRNKCKTLVLKLGALGVNSLSCTGPPDPYTFLETPLCPAELVLSQSAQHSLPLYVITLAKTHLAMCTSVLVHLGPICSTSVQSFTHVPADKQSLSLPLCISNDLNTLMMLCNKHCTGTTVTIL